MFILYMSFLFINYFILKKNLKLFVFGNFIYNWMRRCYLYKCYCVWIKNIKIKNLFYKILYVFD